MNPELFPEYEGLFNPTEPEMKSEITEIVIGKTPEKIENG